MANPPSEITRANALRGKIVRLERPHELPEGDWDGPVYVRLREPRYIGTGHTSPFVLDDSSRRPGWLCDLIYRRYDPTVPSAPSAEDLAAGIANVIIPYSRLTRPEDDLSREFQDRPLLLLFRFVRFRNCFVTAGADSRRFIEVSQAVFLVGQVVAYKSCEGLSFTTPSGVALQPTSNYMCVVTIRQPESAVPVHVLIPAQAAWDSIIPRNEYVVGWCHGVPAHSSPARRTTRFRTRWKEFIVPTTNDEELQRLLRDAFVPTGSDTTVDFGAEPFPLITEFGRVISVKPLEFARTYIGPTRSTARVDADGESDSDDPADILAVGMSRGRSLPRQHPRVTCLETLPRLSFPAPEHWITPPAMTTGEHSTQAVPASTATEPDHAAGPIEATPTGVAPPHQASDLPTPAALGISDAVIATLMSLAQSTQQMVATTQQLLREQRENQQASVAHATVLGPTQTGVTVDTTVVSTGMGDSPPSSNRQLRPPPPVPVATTAAARPAAVQAVAPEGDHDTERGVEVGATVQPVVLIELHATEAGAEITSHQAENANKMRKTGPSTVTLLAKQTSDPDTTTVTAHTGHPAIRRAASTSNAELLDRGVGTRIPLPEFTGAMNEALHRIMKHVTPGTLVITITAASK